MFVTLVAVLCQISTAYCVEEIVTDSSVSSITFMDCQVHGQQGVIQWLSEHSKYKDWRLERYKCIPGHYEVRGRI